MENNIERIVCIGAQTIELYLKESVQINRTEYASLKAHKNNLLFCMLDRTNNHCLIYDYSGLISLSQYMQGKKFNLLEYHQLLLQLGKTINSFKDRNINQNNILLNTQYIYINPNTTEFSFIAIPTSNMNGFEEGYRHLFRELCEESVAVSNVLEQIFNLRTLVKSDFKLNELIYYLEKKCAMKLKIMDTSYIVMSVCNLLIMGLGTIGYIYYINNKISLIDILVLSTLFILFLSISYGLIFIISKQRLKKLMLNNELSVPVTSREVQSEKLQSNIRKEFVGEESIRERGEQSYNNQSSIFSSQNITIDSRNTGLLSEEKYYEESEQQVMSQVVSQPTGLLLDDLESNPYLIKKSNPSERFELNKSRVVIGREYGKTDICLNAGSVSKIHAIITQRNGGYYLCDQNSSNGTFINNKKLNNLQEYPLYSNDLIRFANQEYIFNK